MRWLKPTLNSLYGMLGQGAPAPEASLELRTEQVRQAMLDFIALSEVGARHPQVVRRIRYADDIQGLWYARSDVMTAFADERGEGFAQEQVAVVSRLFDGLLPQALTRGSLRPR